MLALFANQDPEPIDLGGARVTVTLAVDALEALDARSTSYSYTVRLPRQSVRNRRFFGAIDDPGTNAYAPNITGTSLGGSAAARPPGLRIGARVPCRLLVDGYTILEGLLRITKVTEEAIEVQLTGEASPWANTLDATQLRELTTWAPADYPTLDEALIQATWDEAENGTMGGLVDPANQDNRYYFPWVDYGRLTENFSGITYDLTVSALLPAIQMRGLIHAMFAHAGYRLNDRGLIPRELIMLFTGADGWQAGVNQNANFELTATEYVQGITGVPPFAPLPPNTSFGNAGPFDTYASTQAGQADAVVAPYPTPWYPDTSSVPPITYALPAQLTYYRVYSPGTYEVTVDMGLVDSQGTNGQGPYEPGAAAEFAFDINASGADLPSTSGANVTVWLTPDIGASGLPLTVKATNLYTSREQTNPPAGPITYRTQVTMQITVTDADLVGAPAPALIVGWDDVFNYRGQPQAGYTGIDYYLLPSTVTINAPQTTTFYGRPFDPLAILPADTTCLDVVKDILKIGNLYAQTIGTEVTLYTRDEYFRAQTTAGYLPTGTNTVPGAPYPILQLADYVDGEAEEVTWPGQDEPASRTFAWAEDEDALTEPYAATTGKQFASETRTNPNAIDATKTEAIELSVFAATLPRQLVPLDGAQYTGLSSVNVLVLRETLTAEDQGEQTTDWVPRLAFARLVPVGAPQEWTLTDINGNALLSNIDVHPLAEFERYQGDGGPMRSLRFDDTADPGRTLGNADNTGIVTNRYAQQLALRNAARLVEVEAYLPPGVLARGAELFRMPLLWRSQLWYLQEVNQWEAETHACKLKIIKRDG